MQHSDVIIIGGVATGPKTAATLVRRLPNAKVTLFQKSDLLSYSSCGLPYLASGDLSSFEELTQTPYGVARDAAFFRDARGFEAVTNAEVVGIDRDNKTVTIRQLPSDETYQHGYGKLVLATGASQIPPPFPTVRSDMIRTFHTPHDAVAFRKKAEQGKIGSAVIIGGGFVGCELAEAVGSLWGIDTTLIEKEAHVLPGMLDPEMASLVEQELRQQNVVLITSNTVERIETDESGKPVITLGDGRRITTDFVFLALGLRPEVTIARQCGLTIGQSGGIAVNACLQTSDPDIYAGGDCAESVHQITGQPLSLYLGSIANRHGRVIAENLAGNRIEFPGVLGTRLSKVYELNVGATGLSEKEAESAGFHAEMVWGTFSDKPDYIPDAKWLTLKLIYDRDSHRLLGLQAVGQGDICRRIDVFASFLQQKAVVTDLMNFEHGYMPAFSEALDPLHHLAALAEAQQKGVSFLNPSTEFGEQRTSQTLVLDVREHEEADAAPFPSSIGKSGVKTLHIPIDQIRKRLGEIKNGRRIIVVCQRGPRSYQVALVLKSAGCSNVDVLAGGLQAVAS